jgi:hypothetical protein
MREIAIDAKNPMPIFPSLGSDFMRPDSVCGLAKAMGVANDDHLPRGFHRRLVRRDVPADGGHGVDTDKVTHK